MIAATVRVLLAVLILTGCAILPKEPSLQFPMPPHVQFQCIEGQNKCFLSEDDTDALMKWVAELSAFWRARERILNPDGVTDGEPKDDQ